MARMFKMNSDATVKLGSPIVGIGVVFRDNKGVVGATCANQLASHFDLETAKLLAIHEGSYVGCLLGN